MERPGPGVATVHGSSTATQQIFRTLLAEYGRSIRIVGVVEERDGPTGRTCRAGRLRNVTDNVLYPMFEELPPGNAGCDLHGPNVTRACEAVRRDIAAGCDLVVLSKFGKLESTGQGLAAAFAAAVNAGIPLLTSVSPAYEEACAARVGARIVTIPAELDAVRDWLGAHVARMAWFGTAGRPRPTRLNLTTVATMNRGAPGRG
ncbi:MAG: DUF2478 domain-containing protein [Stellaceae bacterium]